MPEYHLSEYLAAQQQETFRACIIHAPAMGRKTALAQRIRDVMGAYLFDVQRVFLERPELCACIDRYRPPDLERLLLGLSVVEPIVIVDNLDFLLLTWTPALRREFAGMIERRLKSPGVTDKTFVFFVQNDPVITRRELKNTRGRPRIVPLDAFYAL